jgi:hypothetical protein
MLDKPVAPKKGQTMALGLLAGLVLGSGAALVFDRKQGLIWNESEIKQILDIPILVHLDQYSNHEIEDNLQPLIQGPLAGNGSVAILSSSSGSSEIESIFKQQLKSRLTWQPFKDINSLNQALNCDYILIELQFGNFTRKDLKLLRSQYELLALKPIGIILS